MDVFIVRHAVAEDDDPRRWTHDAQRPLSAFGRAEFERFIRAHHDLPSHVDLVAASPYLRAQETADLLRSVRGWPAAATWPDLVPGGDTRRVLESLARQPPASVALVSHEPTVSRLLRSLAGPSSHGHSFDKGAIARVEWDPAGLTGGRLRWLQAP